MSEPRLPSLSTQLRRLQAEPARERAAARMRIKLARERETMPRPTRRSLLYAVAAEFGVEADLMVGPRRFNVLVRTRCGFAVIAREKFGASTTQIARTLRRDHTTISHALNNLAPGLLQDPDFAGRLVRVEATLWPLPTETN